MKNHSLLGADVNESDLGKVPSAASADTAQSAQSAQSALSAQSAQTSQTAHNASNLGGNPASAFARSEISNARVSAPGSAPWTTVIGVAGYGHLEMLCGDGASWVSLRYVNDTGSPRYLAESTSDGTYVSELIPNGSSSAIFAGDGATYSFDISDEAAPQRIAHIDASATAGGSVAGLPDECRAAATAIVGPGDS